jgi:hypothetical protein
MKVKRLKQLLEFCNDNDLVVIACDEEGNGYRELGNIDN